MSDTASDAGSDKELDLSNVRPYLLEPLAPHHRRHAVANESENAASCDAASGRSPAHAWH